MIPFGTITTIAALAVVFAFVVARAEGLGFLLPKTTRRLGSSAAGFCAGRCRYLDGRCPLSGSKNPSVACPLWKYVEADLPAVDYGSPFTPV